MSSPLFTIKAGLHRSGLQGAAGACARDFPINREQECGQNLFKWKQALYSAIFMKNIGPAAENDIAVRDVDYRRNTKMGNFFPMKFYCLNN